MSPEERIASLEEEHALIDRLITLAETRGEPAAKIQRLRSKLRQLEQRLSDLKSSLQ